MVARLLSVLLGCSVLTPATLVADEGDVTVAVLEIRAHGIESRVADALLDVVTQEVAAAPHLKVLSRKEMERLLGEEAKKQLMGCDEAGCLAELAGALNAERLVSGEISRLGDSTLLTLQLINNKFATVMNRVSINWPGAADQLPDVAQAASQLLVLERGQRKPGSLELESIPDGAEVFLNEKPLKQRTVSELDVGLHLVRVSLSGHDERVIPVIVKSGKTAHVNAALTRIPLYRRPAFWSFGIVGTGLLGALAATLVIGVPLAFVVFNYGGANVTGTVTPPPTGVSR